MAGPSLNVRVAANIAELRRNLKDGLDQIEVTSAAMTRMANSLRGDRLIQNAHSIVAAVDKIGGAAKLTEAEKAKLNRTLDKAIQKYEVLGQEAPKAMRDLHEATKQVEGSSGGLLSRLTTGMVAVGTAIGTFLGNVAYDALRRVAAGIVEVARRGIEMAPTVSSFHALSAAIGQSGDEMLRVTRTATKGLIADLDIMAAANKAMLLGLPVTADSMATMAQTAVVLGKAMNLGPTKALDDLTTALGRSSPMILDNLGLSVKVGEANEKYAAALSKTSSALTESEKKLAFYNAAMDAAKQKVEELGGIKLTLADQVLRLKNIFINFTDQLGVAIAMSPVLTELFGGLADSIEEVVGDNQVANVQRLVGWINQAGLVVIDVAQFAVEAARGFHVLYSAVMTVVNAVGTSLAGAVTAASFALSGLLGAVAKLPGIGMAGQFQDAADALSRFTLNQAEATKRMFELTKASGNAAGFQGEIQEALGRTSGRLNEMRQRLQEAAQQTVETGDIATRILGPDGEVPTQISEGAKKILEAMTGQAAQKKINEIAEAFLAYGDRAKLGAEKTREYAEQLLKLEQDGGRITPFLRELVNAYRELDGVQQDVKKSLDGILQSSGTAIQAWKDLETEGTKAERQTHAINKRLQEFNTAVTQMPPVKITIDDPPIAPMLVRIRQRMAEVFASLPDVILGAIQGGGDVARAIGASLGGDIMGGLMGEVEKGSYKSGIGKWLQGIFGQTLGGGIAGFLPGLASYVGSLIGGLFRDKEHEKVNDLRDELMKSLGGLEGAHARIAATANDPQLMAAFERLYSAKRVEDYEKAVEAFQKRYAELMREFQAATSQSGTLWNATVRQMIQDYEALGLTIEDVQSIIATQRDAVASSMGAIAAATAQTQDEFDRLSRIGLAAFNTLVAAGLTPIQAAQQLDTSIDSLIGQMEQMGFTGSAAFNELLRISTLVEANAPVLNQVDGLNQLLIATANLSGLTADGFADIEAQGLAAFTQLTAAGFSHEEALAQIAPLLSTIEQLHKDNKVAISDETQELINQARERGLLTGEAVSTNDILMTGIQGLGDLFGRIFGVEVPRWFEQMGDDAADAADRVQDEFDRIRLPEGGFRVDYPSGPGGADTGQPGFAGGTPNYDYLNFGAGRNVRTHGEEAIVPKSGVGQFAADVAAALAPQLSRGGGGQRSATVVLQMNGREVARAIWPDFFDVVDENDGEGAEEGPKTRFLGVR